LEFSHDVLTEHSSSVMVPTLVHVTGRQLGGATVCAGRMA
jgi:hypothetical protein